MNVTLNIIKTKVLKSGNENKKGRVYLFDNDESVLENFVLRATDEVCDPVKLYRKQLLPKVSSMLNLPADAEYKWSRKAGCSCGCSPGFICTHDDLRGTDVFITYDVEV